MVKIFKNLNHPLLWASLLTILCGAHIGENYILFGWFLGLSALVTVLCYSLYKSQVDGIAVLLFWYILINAMYISLLRENIYENVIQEIRLVMSYNATVIIIVSLVMALSIPVFETKLFEFLFFFFAVFCFGNSLAVITTWIVKYLTIGVTAMAAGILDQPGINGALIAITYPFLLKTLSDTGATKRWYVVFSVLALLAVAASRSSTAWGTLILVVCANYLYTHRGIRYAPQLFLGAIIGVIAALLIEGEMLFHSSHRLEAYKLFFSYWVDKANFLFGTGAGSFPLFAIEIQNATNFMVTELSDKKIYYNWLWLHSDWLQVLFEYGVIGLVLCISLFVRLSIKAWHWADAAVFSAIIGFGGLAIFSFPLRYFLSCFLLMFLIIYTLRIGGRGSSGGI